MIAMVSEKTFCHRHRLELIMWKRVLDYFTQLLTLAEAKP
jgi:hypothetical protein